MNKSKNKLLILGTNKTSTRDSADIKRIEEYYKQLYTYKFDSLIQWTTSLKNKLWELIQYEIYNLNCSITIKEIEFIILKLLKMKYPGIWQNWISVHGNNSQENRNTEKVPLQSPTATIIFNSEKLKLNAFLLRSGTRQRCLLPLLLFDFVSKVP